MKMKSCDDLTWANAQVSPTLVDFCVAKVPKSVGVWEVGWGGAPPGLGGAEPRPVWVVDLGGAQVILVGFCVAKALAQVSMCRAKNA